MEKWILLVSLVLALIASVQGALCVHFGRRSRWTVVWLLLSFFGQLAVLFSRGQARGTCPLGDTGEVLIFSAWSLTMCYLAVGSVYRVSLLGVFTAPLVTFLLGLSLIPGMLDADPEHLQNENVWRALHAGFSVLAYGALGLSAVAGVMFLVLNQQLKEAHLTTGLFKKLPPARELVGVVKRLLILGVVILTMGVACGVMMKFTSGGVHAGANHHFILAIGVWLAYTSLISIIQWRGAPPRKVAIASVLLFVFSLLIFIVL